jgi:hypothetical protein
MTGRIKDSLTLKKSKPRTLFFSSFATVVIVLIYWFLDASVDQKSTHSDHLPIDHPAPRNKQPYSANSDNFDNSQVALVWPQTREQLNSLIDDFRTLPNNKLIDVIKTFWQNCHAQNNCDDQLAIIKGEVELARYNLIKEYPEKLIVFNGILQSELNSQDQQLEQKLDEIKAAYTSVWGELSEQLFADELTFYDLRIELDALYQDNQDLDLTAKLELVDNWIYDQQINNSDLDPYNAAKYFFSRELESQSDQKLAMDIAAKYLNQTQSTQEEQHLLRRQFQKDQGQRYQQALSVLHETLALERKEIYGHLNETDWQKYQEEKIRKFKVEFFR